MTQPLPQNIHPSQCYRLLHPKMDTLQAGDQVLFRLGHNGWEWQEIDMCRYGESPQKNHVYRRPFTPPAPVQVQEFWRLLEKGKDTIQDGDEFTYNANDPNPSWKKFGKLQIGATYGDSHYPARRQVTVPVADASKQISAAYTALRCCEERAKEDLKACDEASRHHYEQRLYTIQWALSIMQVESTKEAPMESPVADTVQSLKTFADQEASKIVNAFAGDPKPSGDYAAYRERLFKYAEENFGHTLINSEMDEIEHIVLGFFKHKAHEPIPEPPDSGPYLISVDGHEAPTCEHATISEARAEAERLARQEHPAQVRLLRQVAVARADMTVKWKE